MITPRTLAATVALAALATGCKDKPRTDGATAGSPPPTTAVDAAAAPPPPAPIDEAGVRALVDAWLAAQNGGDFAAYAAQYEERMEGVKRVGPRTWRFDHAGWLADRKRMFTSPMTVTATELAITGTATTPIVEFTQSFRQARFADTGRKRLVLSKKPYSLRIVREEMLVSVTSAPAIVGDDPISPIISIDGTTYVALAPDADVAWATGPIRGPYTGLHRYALRAATAAPAALAAWRGKPLAVYDAAGQRCDATVGDLQLLGGVTPHFGEVQAWDGDRDAGGDGHVWSPAERARAIYDAGDHYLVGALAVQGGCTPVFAATPDRAIRWFAASPPAPARAAAAIAAFRQLPAYRTIGDGFRDGGGTGEWSPAPKVTSYREGATTIVVVSAMEGTGCAEFLGQLTAVFADDGRRMTLLGAGDFHTVAAVIDSDGDGGPELVGAPSDLTTVSAHIVARGGALVPATTLAFPFNDCGC